MLGDFPPGSQDSNAQSEALKKAQIELQKIVDRPMMDMELASVFAFHIDNPCGFETPDGVKHNIRDFYIREVERILPNITNPFARELLESKITEYKK